MADQQSKNILSKATTKRNTMRARHLETGGTARHGVVQGIDVISKAMGVAQGIYAAGRAVMPYVRPALTAIAAAAV